MKRNDFATYIVYLGMIAIARLVGFLVVRPILGNWRSDYGLLTVILSVLGGVGYFLFIYFKRKKEIDDDEYYDDGDFDDDDDDDGDLSYEEDIINIEDEDNDFDADEEEKDE